MLVMLYIPLMWLLTQTTRALLAKPGCQEMCGNIPVPYPYGIGTDCYLHKSFEVLCNGSSHDIAPLQFVHNHKFPILEISMESLRVVEQPNITCIESGIVSVGQTVQLDQHFSYSHQRNVYVAVGCEVSANFQVADTNNGKEVECTSQCLLPRFTSLGTCNGISGCCQRDIPIETRSYSVRLNNKIIRPNCFGAFIVEKDYRHSFHFTWKNSKKIPLSLNWVIAMGTCHQAHERRDSLCGNNTYCADTPMSHGYNCRCMEGYDGNPYLPTGCEGN